MEQNLNFGSRPKEGCSLANKCFLFHNEEESVDQILVYCVKIRVL